MAIAKFSIQQAAEAGTEIALLHPTTDLPLPERVTVYGSDSKVCKDIQRRQANRRIELQTKKGTRKKATVSAEELESEGMDLLVACTKSWRTMLYDESGKEIGSRPEIEFNDGEWLPCTPENVRRLYTEFPFFKEQIDGEIGDRNNFLRT